MLGRRSRAAVIIAAGLSAGALASAGWAVASGTATSNDETTSVDEVTTQPTVTAPTTTDSTQANGTERFWGPECGTGDPTNHGQFVSSSEQTGESRSAAAQSDCGKPLSSLSDSGDDQA